MLAAACHLSASCSTCAALSKGLTKGNACIQFIFALPITNLPTPQAVDLCNGISLCTSAKARTQALVGRSTSLEHHRTTKDFACFTCLRHRRFGLVTCNGSFCQGCAVVKPEKGKEFKLCALCASAMFCSTACSVVCEHSSLPFASIVERCIQIGRKRATRLTVVGLRLVELEDKIVRPVSLGTSQCKASRLISKQGRKPIKGSTVSRVKIRSRNRVQEVEKWYGIQSSGMPFLSRSRLLSLLPQPQQAKNFATQPLVTTSTLQIQSWGKSCPCLWPLERNLICRNASVIASICS